MFDFVDLKQIRRGLGDESDHRVLLPLQGARASEVFSQTATCLALIA